MSACHYSRLYGLVNWCVCAWLMATFDICVPALSARVSWWLSCLQMTREKGTVSVVWVMCERNVHTVILWAHLVMVKTGLLSQWRRWWLTGSSLRSKYFHTMKPDTFFSGQYFTTWCTTWSVSQWYMHMHVVKFSWCLYIYIFMYFASWSVKIINPKLCVLLEAFLISFCDVHSLVYSKHCHEKLH